MGEEVEEKKAYIDTLSSFQMYAHIYGVENAHLLSKDWPKGFELLVRELLRVRYAKNEKLMEAARRIWSYDPYNPNVRKDI